HFGRGLVFTSGDFGKQGEKPSHPELLDWLASEFMDRGWSMKQMHKLIVTSAAYRQQSQVRPELLSRDPYNTLIARQSRLRLPAEHVRDSALAVSGLLYPKIGGKSVRPPQPAAVASIGYANQVKWEESEGKDAYRRGLYIHFQRTTPYPQLMNFDAPEANITECRRERSNTPLQALNLLNDPVFFEAAQALALRILNEAPADFPGRLNYAYQLCFARDPRPSEVEVMKTQQARVRDLIQSREGLAESLFPLEHSGDRLDSATWVGLARVILNLDEFITRE
ncbi:MAG: DUF1553 domain-containing protein, partial [Bryobacteraceae bacterium]